jgi:hypothetical protein
MDDNEREIVWEYIIELALLCACESGSSPFTIVENAKRKIDIPEILDNQP